MCVCVCVCVCMCACIYDELLVTLSKSNRWLSNAGMYIGSERKQRAVSKTIIDGNLLVELTPFSFALSGGGDELRGAPHAFTLSLKQKVVQLLEENET